MKMKLFAILFVTAVLVSSFVASVLPSANALTQRTDFSNRHTSASYGNSRICGDHICKSGEQTQWMMKVSSSQKVGFGKVGNLSQGVDVMHKIAGTTPSPSTMHGNIKLTEKSSMGVNMTDKGNATKSTK
jgi:hypothetical protein